MVPTCGAWLMISGSMTKYEFPLPPDEDPTKRSQVGGETEEFVPAGDAGDDPITRNLKKVYAEVTREPIPDRLLNLLTELDSVNEGPGHDQGD